MDLGYTFLKRHRISEYDPLSAQTEVVQRTVMRRTGWSVRIECRTHLTATRTTFQFGADLEAFEGDEPFAHREWQIADLPAPWLLRRPQASPSRVSAASRIIFKRSG